MIYNSNTGVQKYQAESQQSQRGPTSGQAGKSTQWGLETWTGRAGTARSYKTIHDNATFNPYMNHLSIWKSPNVNYGPMQLMDETTFGVGGRAGTLGLDAYAATQQNLRYTVKVTDPLGRSTFSMKEAAGLPVGFGGEVSLLQLDQTMRELKNRTELESTAAYNRNIPPAAKINRFSSTESIMERVVPGLMKDSRTQIIKPSKLLLPILGHPGISSNIYYDLKTGRIRGPETPGKAKPPELLEELFEENTAWKQNIYHGADYTEGPDTKDKTKETIKTIKATGELVTTDISDSSFTKNREFDLAETEGMKKQTSLQEKMKTKKKAGFLLGMNV